MHPGHLRRHRHDHWRRLGDPQARFRFYMRARLHRRIFMWFGFSIFLTGAVVFTVTTIAGYVGGQGWLWERRGASALVANRFTEIWSDPARRDAVAAEIAKDLDVDVALADAQGVALSPATCSHPWVRADIKQAGTKVGSVAICTSNHTAFGGWHSFLPLSLLCFILWGASGGIARRLARPLSDLAHVARELGRGNLSARAPLRHHQPGEIGILTDAFNDMADRIERQVADQRELLAGVSHELRTPLSRIRLLIELLRDGAGPERLEELEREIIEVDALVGELLASSRLDFAALNPKPIEGGEIARRALTRADIPDTVLNVNGEANFEGDPTLISRALANLIDNAKKYGGGLVSLRVARTDAGVLFEADDAGSGFSEESAKHAFSAFAPETNGQSRGHGSLGLGLALVKRIAEAHGGRAYAGNRPDGGARVGIEVALRPPAPTNGARASA